MARQTNTTKDGNAWTEETKKTVWNEGRVIPKFSSEIWRWDKCGQVMEWSEHGNRQSKNGWEIDHIDPVANGGDDNIENLQPLNWNNNADKADKLNWTCP